MNFPDAKILSKEECAELYPKAHAGDKEAIEKLFNSTILLIAKIASRHMSSQWEMEELISIGVLGFYNAISNGKYDPAKGSWSTYVYPQILSRLLRAKIYNGVVRTKYNPKIESLEEDSGSYLDTPYVEDIPFHRLTDTEAYVIKEHYYKWRTYRDIGQDLGVSRQRIQQLTRKALCKLKSSTYAHMETGSLAR